MSVADLELVLKSIANPDNAIRQQAEQQLTAARQTPDWLLSALLEISKGSSDPVAAQMSVVLLRRYLTKTADSLFHNLNSAKQAEVKAQLLARVAEPHPSATVRRGIAHCTAGLGCQILDSWPELLPALAAALHNGIPEVQVTVLVVFTSLAPHFSDAALGAHAAALRDLCQFAVHQPSVEVKTGGVEVVTELVTYMRQEAQWAPFQSLLPQAITALGQALSEKQWALAERSVQAFIAVAEVTPEFFTAHLKDVIAPFLEVATSPSVDPTVRRLAFEFTLTLAETDPKAVRRLPQYLATTIPLAMQMQLEVQEPRDWGETAPEEAEGEEPDFEFGIEALDRLAVALGGRRVHPIVSPLVAQFAQSGDWRQRHAALWSLSQVAEGCSKEFEGLLPQIAPVVVAGLSDTQARVRHGAIICMAQFCTEFRPQWQADHHGTFMPLLIERLTDMPRVAALAAQACINFLEGAPKEATEPHLDTLLTAVLQLLQSTRHRFVSEAALSAVTAIAAHAETAFSKYYDTVVPWLISAITASATPRADRMLRAKALECITRIALAVGKERFAADAGAVLGAMDRMQRAPLEADDPLTPYLLRAWGRLADYLGPDHYALLMPSLLAQVESKTDIVISDEEGQEAEEGVETLTLALKGLGEKRISIRTSALEEKALAVTVLAQVLDTASPHTAPFLEPLTAALVPLLRFVYMEDVRSDAAACLPALLKAVPQPDGAELVARLGAHFATALAEALRSEPSSTVRGAQLQALSACVEVAPADCLSAGLVTELAELVRKVLADGTAARDRLRVAKRVCEDEEDAERLDEDIEAEEEVLCQALDVTTSLLKRSAVFLPMWESGFFPHYSRFLGTGLFETRLALCAFAAFIESHGSTACAPHLPAILPALLEHCRPDHDDPDVAQVAAYGLGVALAQGPITADLVAPAVQRLETLVRARHGAADWEAAVCNAAAALLRAHRVQAGAAACSGDKVLPVVLAVLPVRGDEEEGQGVHRRVLELLEAGDPAVAPRRAAILQALQPIAGTSFMDAATATRLAALRC